MPRKRDCVTCVRACPPPPQYVFFNKKTKQATRANPAKVLAAAQTAYKDAWEFVTNPDEYEKAAAKAAADKDWHQVFDPEHGTHYWHNATTGARRKTGRSGGVVECFPDHMGLVLLLLMKLKEAGLRVLASRRVAVGTATWTAG